MKKSLTLLIMLVVVMMFSCDISQNVFSKSSEYGIITESKTFYDAEELREVLNSASNSSSVNRGICTEEGLKNGYAYKIYVYSGGLFAEDLKNGKTLHEMMSSSRYGWCIDTNGVTLWMDKCDGKWKATSCSENPTDDPGTVDFDAAEKAIAELENEYGAKDISVQCLYSRNYFGRYLIIYSSVGEFVVPFSYRPDFTGLENGRLYTAGELAEVLVENLPADPIDWLGAADENVEPVALPKRASVPTEFVVCISVIAVSLAVGICAVIYRKKRVAHGVI